MAGPNGSGKSTILKEVRNNFYSGPFVNADEIEKSFKEKGLLNLPSEYNLSINPKAFTDFLEKEGKTWKEKATESGNDINISERNGMLVVIDKPSAYDAALAADFVRHQLLLKGETFTFETVFSHPSKIDFLRISRNSGYKNYLYFICTTDPDINISRVKQRVELGGHLVPEEKIRKRYFESLQLLSSIIPLCYRVFLFDNSSAERSIDPVASVDNEGKFVMHTQFIPWWVEEYVIEQLY